MCETTPAARVTLERSLGSATLVRDFVEDHHCAGHGAPGMAALQLLASELVTNAVLYGADPIWARVSCEVHTMRVEVHDEDREGAVLPGSDGMGLLLVNKVAHEWGTTRTATGKTVWATVATVATGHVPVQAPRSWEEPGAGSALRRTSGEAGSGVAARSH
jgi:anti-sigma regulatory factor (Ser/Thr protein kinase)